MKREPCLWLTTSDPNNGEQFRTRTRMIKGRKVTEKVPQHGHDGDYENRTKAKGRRYIMIVRHEGHVVPLMLTNAAAHLTSGPYSANMLTKARKFGWYPAGACPCRVLASGELTLDHFVSDEARAGVPCGDHVRSTIDEPCPHDVAERVARAKQWGVDHAERMAAFRDPDEKRDEMQRAANADLVTNVANAVAERVASAKSGKRAE